MKDPCAECLLKIVCIEACKNFCKYLIKINFPYSLITPSNMLDRRIANAYEKIIEGILVNNGTDKTLN
ncbi:MAG: hypothetical protein ACFFG0_00430 [Candidatus Thorarchaeota archaeon]